MPKIILSRTSQRFNHGREFKVLIDNIKVDSISDGEEKTIEITEGNHNIFLKVDGCKSRKVDINLHNNEEVKLKCGSITKAGIFVWLSSLFIDDKLIHLDYYSSYCFDTSDYWDEMIKKGRKHYILQHGVLRFGMILWVIHFIDSSFFGSHHPISIMGYIVSLIDSLISCLVFGYFWGAMMWKFLKWRNE